MHNLVSLLPTATATTGSSSQPTFVNSKLQETETGSHRKVAFLFLETT
jgi:hypothetical protein